MATKKKTQKKSTQSKKTVGRKGKPTKKQAKRTRTPKKSAKKTAAPHKVAAGKKSVKALRRKTAKVRTGETQKKSRGRRATAFSRETQSPRSGELAGDLQGLSDNENVDSESVDELMEEGNAFEAGIVSGVEDSRGRGEREVRTREVPEDDVPGEYLDND
jgi:hypothetical protein